MCSSTLEYICQCVGLYTPLPGWMCRPRMEASAKQILPEVPAPYRSPIALVSLSRPCWVYCPLRPVPSHCSSYLRSVRFNRFNTIVPSHTQCSAPSVGPRGGVLPGDQCRHLASRFLSSRPLAPSAAPFFSVCLSASPHSPCARVGLGGVRGQVTRATAQDLDIYKGYGAGIPRPFTLHLLYIP